MNWWQALILGIVEGLTEYLPVSSTGHLILVSWMLGLAEDPQRWEAANTFNIIIQAGAIAAVLGLYWSRVRQMAGGLLGRDEPGRRLLINVLIAFLPAAVLGPLLNHRIEAYLFKPWPVVGALFVGAWLMLAVARSRSLLPPPDKERTLDDLDWQSALLIGFGQCIALWPGTSRSMMTIVAALMIGLRAKDAAEFSFLLGLLTLSAATAYKVVFGGAAMIHQFGIAAIVIGFLAATVSAAVAVKWMVGFLTRHGVAPFGWYRLAVAIILALLIWSGFMTVPVLE